MEEEIIGDENPDEIVDLTENTEKKPMKSCRYELRSTGSYRGRKLIETWRRYAI